MAIPPIARLRRREPAPTPAAVPSVRRLRAPAGAMVAHYRIPNGPGGPEAVTAAAQVIYGGSVSRTVKRAPSAGWQADAWTLRKEVGEFRFSGDRVARAVSQCRLFVAKLPAALDAQPEPVTDGVMGEISRQLFGNAALVQQEMRRGGQHLAFNGESLLLVRQDEQGRLSWGAHSVTEITGTGETMRLNNGVETVVLSEWDMVVRCWAPDPELGGLADAPARSVLPVARELKGLTEHTSAQIDSRLAGAGLLLVPDTIEVMGGQSSTPAEGDEDAEMDDFVRALVESMTVPLTKRDSAASIVPLVAKVPPDAIDKIQHITFASPFDAMAKDMREEAIRRVALGMDSDPSVLLGLGGGNHWSAWLVSEDEVSLVISPIAATLCHAFTVGVLRPLLSQVAPDVDPNEYLVWFDASELELRPDKSADARTLHDADLLSDAAAMIANGFDPKSDAPSEDERTRRLLVRLLLAKPDLASAILPALGIDLDIPEPVVVAPPAAPADQEQDPAEEDDKRELPDTEGDPPPSKTSTPGPGA